METPVAASRGDIVSALREPPPSSTRVLTPQYRPTLDQELELEQERQAQALRDLDALRLVYRGAHHRRGAFDGEDGDDGDAAGWADLSVEPTWRLRERMKTVSVALVLCLNIGTDPPDAIAASPWARRECWLEPFAGPSRQKALETIGAALQAQYERWQSRARYRQLLDPTADELRRLCAALRRSARNDRVLVHLNGHGVPRPTANGEVWVFNKNYTQYIPLSVYELRAVVQAPAVFVLDCSGAGILLPHFRAAMPTKPTEDGDEPPPPAPKTDDCIVLAPCAADETLPSDPRLPADLFTACLTTPISVALRDFVRRHPDSSRGRLDEETVEAGVPGRLGDRKTPLGELNWIFTAVTDTIAWNVLPARLFQRLFREDLLLASLFRNFLLAERVFRRHGRTPATIPALPPTADHPLWATWDLAAEGCLARLASARNPSPAKPPSDDTPAPLKDAPSPRVHHRSLRVLARVPPVGPEPAEPSPFFEEQLTAFEVWLRFGAGAVAKPEQLPVVLQVLLSQAHRVRALVLLRRFLELGPRAVDVALCVGIFPYVLKLLQSPAPELRRPLVAIWASILAFDGSCRSDLARDGAREAFVAHLTYLARDDNNKGEQCEQKRLAAFILATVCRGEPSARDACLAKRLHEVLLDLLRRDGGTSQTRDLRRWLLLCAGALCDGAARDATRSCRALRDEVLRLARKDADAPARACALDALGSMFCAANEGDDDDDAATCAACAASACRDGSAFVRREAALLVGALAAVDARHARALKGAASEGEGSYADLWRFLTLLTRDPFAPTAVTARAVQDAILHDTSIDTIRESGGARRWAARRFGLSLRSTSVAAAFSASSTSLEELLAADPLSKNGEMRLYRRHRNRYCLREASSARKRAKDALVAREQEKRTPPVPSPQKVLRFAQTRTFDNIGAEMTSLARFHPFESILAVVDEKSGVSLWDVNQGAAVARFANGDLRTTSLEWLNAHSSSLLVAGDADGVVRVWGGLGLERGPYEERKVRLVSAFRAVEDVQLFRKSAGLVCSWSAREAHLYCAGDSDSLVSWDLERESLVRSLHTETDACATVVATLPLQPHRITVGFGDGSLKLFDLRDRSHRPAQAYAHEHSAWIVHADVHKHNPSELCSGCVAGDLKFWDARVAGASQRTLDVQNSAMTALSAHAEAPLLASGSHNQFVKFMLRDGDQLNIVRYHDGVFGQRIGPVASLAFHPTKLIAAAGSTDSVVGIYSAS